MHAVSRADVDEEDDGRLCLSSYPLVSYAFLYDDHSRSDPGTENHEALQKRLWMCQEDPKNDDSEK